MSPGDRRDAGHEAPETRAGAGAPSPRAGAPRSRARSEPSATADHAAAAPPRAALIAVMIGATAAVCAGAMGYLGYAIVMMSLGLAQARFSGRALGRILDRPRLFTVIGALYLPIFLADLVLSARINPVTALIRLVIFLVVAVSACGAAGTAHRMLLLGLLFLVAAAGETTEIWIAIPMVAFMTAAVWAQMRESLEGAGSSEARHAAGPASVRIRPVAALVGGALAIGGVMFFAIPRYGAGWGQRLAAAGLQKGLDAGLSDSVNLGAVGRVKLDRKIAFTAHLRGAPVDPDTIYWRGGSYARWTGRGWSMDLGEAVAGQDAGGVADRDTVEGDPTRSAERDRTAIPARLPSLQIVRSLSLPAGGAVALTPLAGPAKARTDLAAEIETQEDRSGMLFSPGYPVWIKTPWNARVLLGSDGALRGPTGSAPRHYEIGASAGSVLEPRREGAYLDVDRAEPEVARWADRVAPRETDARALARAFVADLSKRTYSLDTRGVDPARPLGSFLEGAPAHCEYFASAMAIGLRHRGIPARVVGGFLGADASTFSDALVVRESRAHMWVEAWLPDQGWTRFDPTPEAGRVPSIQWRTRLVDAWQGLVRRWDALVIGLDLGDQASMLVAIEQGWDAAMRWLGGAWGPLSAIGTGLGICVGLVLAARMRRRRGRSAANAAVPSYYRRLLALAGRRGVRDRSEETARELAFRIVEAFDATDRDAVELLTDLYEKERFAGRPPGPEEQAAAGRALARLRRSSRRAA